MKINFLQFVFKFLRVYRKEFKNKNTIKSLKKRDND